MDTDRVNFEEREYQAGEELTRTIVGLMSAFSERNVIYALTQSLAVALHLSSEPQERERQLDAIMRKVEVFLAIFRDQRQVDNLRLN